ncbi:class I SAM-dependent methyltransferase [Herbiconiux daphne]|uniref:Methyltransferase domain-containing protein n=1 Tax=Herbiconiux daphne TaxID=2970914 RepID=A0ABT2H2J6_9MICO|nr:methyltransferase domain-containing protein [Herbiconiux daphne]MCS5734127.1 methyltransferase domain-containing protein [Herbiconiux daphne]
MTESPETASGHDGETGPEVFVPDETWSQIAGEWSALWGSFADPVRRVLMQATGVRAGIRVLDVGSGSGEFLEMLVYAGADATGADPAPGMVELARDRVADARVVLARAEALPWSDATFDVVVAVNSLQFAGDGLEALDELTRVLVPGGRLAVANWAEHAENEIDAVEAAVAGYWGETLAPDDDLRVAGGLERLLTGLEIVDAGLVEAEWAAADDDTLVRGVLLGEDAATQADLTPVVVTAAQPFRTAEGGYRLRNAFRYAVGRVPH